MINTDMTILQVAPCSFDAHFEEIIGALYFAGTIIMLPPNGNLDLKLMCNLIEIHQITFVLLVPTMIDLLSTYVSNTSNNHQSTLQTLKILSSAGMSYFLD